MFKRVVLFAVLAAVLLSGVVVAQSAAPTIYKARSFDDIDFGRCPYARLIADPIRIAEQDDRDKGHPGLFDTVLATRISPEGYLVRPTSITMADMSMLECFLTQNDLVGLWHQLDQFGPVTSVYQLSEIRTVSLTRQGNAYDPEPQWTFSSREIITLLMLFDLDMGTYNGDWPARFF